jgi:hypothetical protein
MPDPRQKRLVCLLYARYQLDYWLFPGVFHYGHDANPLSDGAITQDD